MNLNGFNSRPYMVPVNPNPNFTYFCPVPVMPFPIHLPSVANWAQVPLQVDPRHSLLHQLAASQSSAYRHRLNLAACRSLMIENMSTCTISDDCYDIPEKQEYQHDRLVKTEHDTHDNSVEEISESGFIQEKEEAISTHESYSDYEKNRFNTQAKLEYKIEDDQCTVVKMEQGWQAKREAYDDDEDYEKKHVTWENDVTSEDPGSLLPSFEGSHKLTLKMQLKEMIDFIIEHFGRIREDDLQKERMKYEHNPILLKVFEVLHAKYTCTFKTRAEIVKYITRKAFSTIKNNSKKESDATSREACQVLCKRYFQVSSEEIQSSGVDIENRERFLQLLFPYQKNSKNKLQDMQLISKLMSSKEFYEDYCLYIQDLGSILEIDNNRKLNKFITFVITCINKGQIDSIMKYKRVPWLKAWLDNTKLVARELAFSIQWKGQQTSTKRVKKESKSNGSGSTQVPKTEADEVFQVRYFGHH